MPKKQSTNMSVLRDLTHNEMLKAFLKIKSGNPSKEDIKLAEKAMLSIVPLVFDIFYLRNRALSLLEIIPTDEAK